MILATHAIVGAALGHFVPSNVGAFAAGFISHFLLDSFPHWDYPLASSSGNESNPLDNDLVLGGAFLKDLFKIGLDFVIGAALVILASYLLTGTFFRPGLLLGAFGGVLPDFLQFVYMKLRRQPLIWLQRFHIWIHTRHNLSAQPFLGVSVQVLIMVGSLAAIIYG